MDESNEIPTLRYPWMPAENQTWNILKNFEEREASDF